MILKYDLNKQTYKKVIKAVFGLRLLMLQCPLISDSIWLLAGAHLNTKGSLALEFVCIVLKAKSDHHFLSSGFKVHTSSEVSH